MAEQIVILGAGYGGLKVAHILDELLFGNESLHKEYCNFHKDYKIVLIDKNDYHTLMTQLYQPAAGTKELNGSRIPMMRILNERNIKFVKGHIDGVDFENRHVIVNQTEKIPFKYLVNALGNEAEHFNIPGLKENSISLNSLNNAAKIKSRVDKVVADLASATEKQATFVIGGGGLTGVEFAGELADHLQEMQYVLKIKPEQYKIILVEGSPHLLPGLSSTTYKYAEKALKKLGVEVITADLIKKATAETVYLASGREINYTEFIWAGGIKANGLSAKSGLKTDARGRVEVNEYLQCPEDKHVYIIGDSALVKDPRTGKPVIATAQAAMQHGRAAANNIFADIMGLQKKPYRPSIIFLLIHIGRNTAVGEAVNKLKFIKLKGSLAVRIKNLIPLKYSFVLGGLDSLLCDLVGQSYIKYPIKNCGYYKS